MWPYALIGRIGGTLHSLWEHNFSVLGVDSLHQIYLERRLSMLERYFVKPDTIDRIRASWIGELVEQYVKWLTENHYSRNLSMRMRHLRQQFSVAPVRYLVTPVC
jgi:hypothetical protein